MIVTRLNVRSVIDSGKGECEEKVGKKEFGGNTASVVVSSGPSLDVSC